MAEQLSWEEYEAHAVAAVREKLSSQGEKSPEAERQLMQMFGSRVGTEIIVALERPAWRCDCGALFRLWGAKRCWQCEEREAMDTVIKERIRFYRELEAMRDGG